VSRLGGWFEAFPTAPLTGRIPSAAEARVMMDDDIFPPGDPFPSQARLRRRPRHERGGQNDRNSQNERDERNGLGRAKARLLAALPSRATSSQCAGASIIGGVLLYLLAFLARRAHVAEAQAFCATVHSTGVEMDMSLRVSLLVKMGAADQSTLRVRCTGTR
jgi:hypothetical protein